MAPEKFAHLSLDYVPLDNCPCGADGYSHTKTCDGLAVPVGQHRKVAIPGTSSTLEGLVEIRGLVDSMMPGKAPGAGVHSLRPRGVCALLPCVP